MDDENISSEDIFDAIYLHQDVKLFPSTNERYGIQYQGKYLSEWDKNVYRNKITYLRLNEIPLYIHAGLKNNNQSSSIFLISSNGSGAAGGWVISSQSSKRVGDELLKNHVIASKLTGAWDIIRSLKNGPSTLLGENDSMDRTSLSDSK